MHYDAPKARREHPNASEDEQCGVPTLPRGGENRLNSASCFVPLLFSSLFLLDWIEMWNIGSRS